MFFPGPEELGRVYVPALGIPANSSRFAEALADMPPLDSKPSAG